MTLSGGVIMVAMDRENRNSHIDVEIFVIHMVECPLEVFTGVTEHFQLTGLIAQTVHPDRAHYLVHGFSGRLVLVKEIACEKHHVDITLSSEAHHLMETLPTVIAPDRVSFVVPDMVVGCNQDADCFRVWSCY